MPTLAAPQSVTVTSTVPNGFISVDCSAGGEMLVTWVSPGSISGQRTVKGNAEDIGPFADQTVITFRSISGAPTYTEPLAGPGLTPAQAAALAGNGSVGAGLALGQSSGWVPLIGVPERFGAKLTAGTGTTVVTMDYSQDGSTSAGQVGTFDLDTVGQTVITQPMVFPDSDDGADASHIRFTVTSGNGTVDCGRGL